MTDLLRLFRIPVAVLVVAFAALVGSTAAGAGNFPIYRCPWTSTSLGTSNAGQHLFFTKGDGSPQQPLTLHFGWAASSLKQVNNFLAVQWAQDGGTITDSNGSVVWSYEPTPFTGWGVGLDLGVWTTPTYTTGLTTPGGQPASGYVTVHNVPISGLPNGDYVLSLEWDVSQRVLDGYQTAKAGSIYKTTNCQFTVQGY